MTNEIDPTTLPQDHPDFYTYEDKFEFTGETNERGMKRIRAIRDIPRYGVKKGDLGGWLESDRNLSQEGPSWVQDNAEVTEQAIVGGYALIKDNVYVWGTAVVAGKAIASGDAIIGGSAVITEDVDGGTYFAKEAVDYSGKEPECTCNR